MLTSYSNNDNNTFIKIHNYIYLKNTWMKEERICNTMILGTQIEGKLFEKAFVS